MQVAFDLLKLVLEPSGALGLAALLMEVDADKDKKKQNKSNSHVDTTYTHSNSNSKTFAPGRNEGLISIVVATGGNVDKKKYCELLSRA